MTDASISAPRERALHPRERVARFTRLVVGLVVTAILVFGFGGA